MGDGIPAGKSRREIQPLFILLFLGLCHGLVYVFLIPPWQHYDEPTQFEYAWLLANRPGLPEPDDYDQGMRREVAASMVEHSFFEHLNFRPNLLSQREPIWIGIAQTGDRPLYYWIVSLPLRLLRGADVTFQLTLGRFVSLFFYLLCILAAYGITAELTPPGHLLRWLAPLALVLLPGFTELMTAINNDVGATAFFALFLWSGIRLLVRPFSWATLIACVFLALACLWTKVTVAVAVPLVIILFLFSMLRGRRKRIAWIGLAAAGLAGILLVFTWNDAALWYRSGRLASPTRAFRPDAPLGSQAIQLVQQPGGTAVYVFHLLPRAAAAELSNSNVTLGAWMWASEAGTIQTISLYDGQQSHSFRAELGKQPAFYAFSARLSRGIQRLEVRLSPGRASGEAPLHIYSDGLVLAKGNRPLDAPPEFADPQGRAGQWGGRPFTNLIRNASAEQAWLSIRPWAELFLQNNFPIYSPFILTSLGDAPGAGWYYRETSLNLLQTFWGRFGWGQIPLAWPRVYLILGAATLAGMAGALVYTARRWRALPKEVMLLLGIALLAVWGAAFFRGIYSLNGPQFIPSSRYAFPVAFPTLLALLTGWLELLRPLARRIRIDRRLQAALIVLFFVGLDVLAIWSIARYYG